MRCGRNCKEKRNKMRAVVQRVTGASVSTEGEVIGKIQKGFMVLLGVGEDDTEDDIKYIADKIIGLRVFEDENGKMNLSIQEVGGEVLLISQFTLYGDCRKGRRPSFDKAGKPEKANELYEKTIQYLRDKGVHTECGKFGADMQVELVNDGPVTLLLESKKQF